MFHEAEPNMEVDRLELIERLKKNRANHKDQFDLMCKGYKVLVAEANEKFQELLKKELENKEPHEVSHSTVYSLAFKKVEKPTEHLSDYDEVIEMMEWTKGDSVRISLRQFKKWIRDEWSWYGGFIREGELPIASSGKYNRMFGKEG